MQCSIRILIQKQQKQETSVGIKCKKSQTRDRNVEVEDIFKNNYPKNYVEIIVILVRYIYITVIIAHFNPYTPVSYICHFYNTLFLSFVLYLINKNVKTFFK